MVVLTPENYADRIKPRAKEEQNVYEKYGSAIWMKNKGLKIWSPIQNGCHKKLRKQELQISTKFAITTAYSWDVD